MALRSCCANSHSSALGIIPALCRCVSRRADTSLKGKKTAAVAEGGDAEEEADCANTESAERGEPGEPGLENDLNLGDIDIDD